jgi:hypothetical protein
VIARDDGTPDFHALLAPHELDVFSISFARGKCSSASSPRGEPSGDRGTALTF